MSRGICRYMTMLAWKS